MGEGGGGRRGAKSPRGIFSTWGSRSVISPPPFLSLSPLDRLGAHTMPGLSESHWQPDAKRPGKNWRFFSAQLIATLIWDGGSVERGVTDGGRVGVVVVGGWGGGLAVKSSGAGWARRPGKRLPLLSLLLRVPLPPPPPKRRPTFSPSRGLVSRGISGWRRSANCWGQV